MVGESAVNLSGLFNIGASWAQSIRSSGSAADRTSRASDAAASAPGGSLNVNAGSFAAGAAEAVRDAIRNATASFRAAFSTFTSRSKAVFTPTLRYTGSPARLSGGAARVTAVDDPYSVLQASVAINTQPTTVRSSSSSIGLDLSTAASSLASSALGLDLTSPDAASTLTSSSGLGLDVTTAQAASTLQSTTEITPATTSYGSTTLGFTGPGQASSSDGTLSGTYTGVNTAAAATSLTVEMNAAASLNALIATSVTFDVKDQTGAVLFSFDGNLKSGDEVYLGDDIGLTVSFSTGTLRNNHTASTTVTHTNNNVDGTAIFNNADVNLRPQFGGAQVTAGSFTVNGASITVAANDTINAVLGKINASAAGVTTTLANDLITVTSNANSEDAIVLAGDTSGFLSATKLSAATTTVGNIHDDQQVLADTSQFGAATTGSFSVNGVAISVNKDTDTLASVLSRITASAAGVTATFDSATNRIVLTGTTNSQDLITVSGDTTGFLATANLATGNTVRGHLDEDTVAFSNLSGFASVTTGSFEVDGQTIAVSAADTIQSIVSKINSSGARVTADFDAGTNKLNLTTTYDTEDDISIGSDTSGFLAAAGVDSGNTVQGRIADDEDVLSATSAFGAVTTGAFEVNGVSISIDVDADTLEDVISRINAAGAGVTASYDSGADGLVFTPDVAGATLSLDADTAGFLAAANVAAGTVGTSVDVNAAFDAAGEDGPLFDPGMSVQAGSFTVNGVSIAVGASDTVATVLTRITASAAGVTASYDQATQKVRLQSTAGSTPIVLASDTSGFLDAVKLDGTAQVGSVAHTVSAFSASLDAMAEYSDVAAGTITINGNQIAVDPAMTTINGLVSAINATSDLTATVDAAGAITISTSANGATMIVDDTSDLLAELGISTGTHVGAVSATEVVQQQTGTVTVTNSTAVAAKAREAVEQLNAALARVGSDKAALQDTIDALRDAGVQGLSLTPDGESALVSIDSTALATSLSRFGDEATLTAVVQGALDGLGERMAASAAGRTSDEEKAKQRLAVEQAQAALMFVSPMRPRAPAAAATIRTVPPAGRRVEPKPAAKPASTLATSTAVAAPGPDLLKSIFDLFADGVAAQPAQEEPAARSWWRW